MRIKFILILPLLAAFIGFSFFGFVFGTAEYQTHAKMSSCPYMDGQMALCPLDIVDHLSAWQSTLQTVPVQSVVSLLAALCAGVLLYVLFRRLEHAWAAYERQKIFSYARVRIQAPPFMAGLFARGILNPKSY